MARNESPENEFDQEMERLLREHFESEAADLQSSRDPWPWLESRMKEPAPPSFFPRILGNMNPVKQGRLSPAFAVASVAVVAVAVTAVVWAATGDGGTETLGGPEDLAVVQPAESQPIAAPAAAATSIPAAVARDASATTAPQPAAERETQALSAAALPTQVPSSAVPTPASAATPASAPAVVPTPSPAPRLGTVVPTIAPAAVARATPDPSATEVPVAVTMPTPAAAPTESPAAMAVATPSPQAEPAAAAAPAMSDAAGPRGPRGRPGPYGPRVEPGPTGGTPPDTTFRDYQRQQFVAASEDNVSTFSLDTDRTSFHLALNWARSGFEIDPDSVRAEEWLNAFDYQYDPPSRDDRFAIRGDLYPHPLGESRHLARISLQAPRVVDDKPVNVTLVLDASGSMADGNRVAIARQAAESIRRSLRSEDRIAVVHFTEEVISRYTVEHTNPEDGRVRDSISWLQPHGSTNVQAGLNQGVTLADQVRDRRPDSYNYVILMSDGVANVDATDPFAILETAYDTDVRNPLRLITIGVGINNYNDPLLEQLAQHGNGWYRYLDSPEQAQATFTRENWLALSVPFADQTRAQVTWNAGAVERWRIIGYENRVTDAENFTQDRKEFAEVYSGAATTVLYEFELTDAGSALTNVPLGSVELRWVDPATGDSRSQTAALSGNPAAGFDGKEGALAQFGTIVALAADLYGGLPDHPEEPFTAVHSGLTALQTQLSTLQEELGTLDSYHDFSFLLAHITGDLEERLPPSTPSGYSR